ncbi:hypothetical protein C8Q76DRAFT_4837 [Earliella scabrosa]|nr:hypothetical protein C8Q76DRAFT_4837 [Earliella scabrosa]
MSSDDSHLYAPAGPNDSRSPCPALNALANHGYLPRDGRNITQAQLVSTLRDVYNISCPFGTILAVGGLALCGRKKPGLTLARELDLHDLARHNAIEHDGSLVHADAPDPKDKYAPAAVDPALLQQLLNVEPQTSTVDFVDASLSLEDLCRAQVRRQSAGQSRPLNALHAFFARGELALLYEVMGVTPADARRMSMAWTLELEREQERDSAEASPTVAERQLEAETKTALPAAAEELGVGASELEWIYHVLDSTGLASDGGRERAQAREETEKREQEEKNPGDSLGTSGEGKTASAPLDMDVKLASAVAEDGDAGAMEERRAGKGRRAAKVVPKRFLEQWLGEERLPEGWERPTKAIGHTTLHTRAQQIGKMEDAMRAEARDH